MSTGAIGPAFSCARRGATTRWSRSGSSCPAAPRLRREARQTLTALLAPRLDASDLLDVTVLDLRARDERRPSWSGRRDATIVVHVAIAPDVVRVEVCDRGPGFTRLPPRRASEGGGNGLVCSRP